MGLFVAGCVGLGLTVVPITVAVDTIVLVLVSGSGSGRMSSMNPIVAPSGSAPGRGLIVVPVVGPVALGELVAVEGRLGIPPAAGVPPPGEHPEQFGIIVAV